MLAGPIFTREATTAPRQLRHFLVRAGYVAALFGLGVLLWVQGNLLVADYGLLYGEEISREQIADSGWQCMQDEWEFNRRAGFDRKDDVMPDCMMQDAIGPQKVVFDVDPEIVAKTYEPYEPDEAFWAKTGTA